MLVYNHLQKIGVDTGDLGVGAVCFMVVYMKTAKQKKGKKNMLKPNTFEKNIKQENWFRKPWMMSV